MPLYRVTTDKLEAVPATSFADAIILERKDLQRMLRSDISPIGDDLMVVAEEFSDWEESSCRIDLLCLDKEARLVVIEIKRTEDGGHMELQAIRYAAMVSKMTLGKIIDVYARTMRSPDAETTARREVLDFLERDSTDEAKLVDEVRIVLVSADFSVELTTAVMWLNEHDLDITCIRLKPYRLDEQVLIDATQIIPPPEAEQYYVKVREHTQEARKVRSARHEMFRRFWAQYIERSLPRTALLANRRTSTDHWLSAGIGRTGFSLTSSVTEDRARIECYIRLGKDSDERNMAAFDALRTQKAEIEQAFGGPLDWQDLPDRIGCRICIDLEGGWRTPEEQWPELQDRMLENLIQLERALKGPVLALRL